MNEEEYVALNQLSRDRVSLLRADFLERLNHLETEIAEKIEAAKQNSILAELKKLGDRIGRLEARIPDPVLLEEAE